ncbi:hypothetical protein QBC47DRAFT_413017 [Echria macrotheca]|uniref:Uncharacterized protein n=1 Tax=Echria macrotheca TaxID=438768 RepID=A0AAJ0FCH0_9PEZI|nr:hypothetical protein QBC47DRAFT_413017 [Echria macrotheca]
MFFGEDPRSHRHRGSRILRTLCVLAGLIATPMILWVVGAVVGFVPTDGEFSSPTSALTASDLLYMVFKVNSYLLGSLGRSVSFPTSAAGMGVLLFWIYVLKRAAFPIVMYFVFILQMYEVDYLVHMILDACGDVHLIMAGSKLVLPYIAAGWAAFVYVCLPGVWTYINPSIHGAVVLGWLYTILVVVARALVLACEMIKIAWRNDW